MLIRLCKQPLLASILRSFSAAVTLPKPPHPPPQKKPPISPTSQPPLPKKALKYRSSDAAKLIELNSRYSLLKPGIKVLEIGSAPGSWTQVIVQKVGEKDEDPLVVSVDIEKMAKVKGSIFVHGDISDEKIYKEIEQAMRYTKVDLVKILHYV